jgi:hypothetical protein
VRFEDLYERAGSTMNALIVCGRTRWCDLTGRFASLQAAGVAEALPAENGSIRTMAQWHDRLFARRQSPARRGR